HELKANTRRPIPTPGIVRDVAVLRLEQVSLLHMSVVPHKVKADCATLTLDRPGDWVGFQMVQQTRRGATYKVLERAGEEHFPLFCRDYFPSCDNLLFAMTRWIEF